MSNAGWYPDPDNRAGTERYWDGQQWGEIRPSQAPTPPPPQTAWAPPSGTPAPPSKSKKPWTAKRALKWGGGGLLAIAVLSAVANGGETGEDEDAGEVTTTAEAADETTTTEAETTTSAEAETTTTSAQESTTTTEAETTTAPTTAAIELDENSSAADVAASGEFRAWFLVNRDSLLEFNDWTVATSTAVGEADGSAQELLTACAEGLIEMSDSYGPFSETPIEEIYGASPDPVLGGYGAGIYRNLYSGLNECTKGNLDDAVSFIVDAIADQDNLTLRLQAINDEL